MATSQTEATQTGGPASGFLPAWYHVGPGARVRHGLGASVVPAATALATATLIPCKSPPFWCFTHSGFFSTSSNSGESRIEKDPAWLMTSVASSASWRISGGRWLSRGEGSAIVAGGRRSSPNAA